ncbi:hypothetical protein F511_41705 [Dorcoceras hygrometricum]|uniref:Uncharacterized protein n=1 Tax=Dorcoceras hygrometricum TaxID=472368 RepID=A0A2Z7AYC8_9LAMI|nr:hypothetical protein F511_41705 [Dorcoceras hygrometricum]
MSYVMSYAACCVFLLSVLLAEPLGSLAFLVQVSQRRSNWEVESESVTACECLSKGRRFREVVAVLLFWIFVNLY